MRVCVCVSQKSAQTAAQALAFLGPPLAAAFWQGRTRGSHSRFFALAAPRSACSVEPQVDAQAHISPPPSARVAHCPCIYITAVRRGTVTTPLDETPPPPPRSPGEIECGDEIVSINGSAVAGAC